MRINRIHKQLLAMLMAGLTLTGCSQQPPRQINTFTGSNQIAEYQQLFARMDAIEKGADTTLTIVHIGDSHLQAAYLSEKIKEQLQQRLTPADTLLSPGLVFPFSLAHTNNPFYYITEGSDTWQRMRNVDAELNMPLGLSGISLQTDTTSQIAIKFRNNSRTNKYIFSQLQILGQGNASFQLNGHNYSVQHPINLHPSDSIKLQITPAKDSQFTLQGLILENAQAKIHYHTLGVNGAQAKSYLRCHNLQQQLKMLNPDWVIVSLGTNEAYAENFRIDSLEHQWRKFLTTIERAAPHAAKLICTPNDHYNRNQQPNPNTLPLITMQKKLAREYHWATWDFYTLMGGFGSIEQWANESLTAKDKIHFTRKGYEKQGMLFIDALDQTREYNPAD